MMSLSGLLRVLILASAWMECGCFSTAQLNSLTSFKHSVGTRRAVSLRPHVMPERRRALVVVSGKAKSEGYIILRDVVGGLPVTGGYSSFSELFSKFDKDLSGKISLDELRSTFRDMGIALAEKQVQEILVAMDTSGDGEVNWAEFMGAIETIESDLYEEVGTNSVMQDDDF